jgi:hypothetical protein
MSRPRRMDAMLARSLGRNERRGAIRYTSRVPGDCQPVTANEAGNRWPVHALDISTSGVGLLLGRRFEPGTLLAVELHRHAKHTAYLPLARVCRVVRFKEHWLLGCAWEGTVAVEEIRSVVGATSMWQAAKKNYRRTKAVLEFLCGAKARERESLGA